jgi:hypothetical protein
LASAAFDSKPVIAEIASLLQPSAGERQARRLIELVGKLGAVAALVQSGSPFSSAYATTRITGTQRDNFGSADLKSTMKARCWNAREP